jgi:hypothetical protein
MNINEIPRPQHAFSRIVAVSAILAVMLFPPRALLAAPVVYDENFDDDFQAGRTIPNGVDATRSSPFAPIDACRPDRSGKLLITSRDISSLECPPLWRTSCCGPALGFEDGGGTYVTFRYSSPTTIQSGSYVSFKVNGYGGDSGALYKSVSTNGSSFSLVPGSTASSAMGNYLIPLPTGGTEVFFRLQVGNASIYDGVIVDEFHAVLYDTPQAPPQLLEGVGNVCVFNAEPFCGGGGEPAVGRGLSPWGIFILVSLLLGVGAFAVTRQRKQAA